MGIEKFDGHAKVRDVFDMVCASNPIVSECFLGIDEARWFDILQPCIWSKQNL